MKVCILAGGSGSRLWPYSRPDSPKQFLPLLQEKSLFASAIEKALQVAEKEEVFAITGSAFADTLQNVFAIDEQNVIVEPQQKNTAPAVIYTLKWLQEKGDLLPNEPVLFLPSDHWIEEDVKKWRSCIAEGVKAVEKGHIALFGVRPTRPETGYGYIRAENSVGKDFFSIAEFVEKPDQKRAERYFLQGDYFWNSGLFIVTAALLQQELQKWCPQLYPFFSLSLAELQSRFDEIESISFDYAILEKTPLAALIPFSLGWSDLGTWESVYEYSSKDVQGNVSGPQAFAADSTNTFILAEKRFISCVGVSDLVVIDTGDTLLIAKRGKTQEAIQATLEYLKKEKHKESAV
jgi:mannose-1-phosphate guanylyltransferase/mannose-6-phosphate isomerase